MNRYVNVGGSRKRVIQRNDRNVKVIVVTVVVALRTKPKKVNKKVNQKRKDAKIKPISTINVPSISDPMAKTAKNSST